jgi:nucleotide-binding universal stress UspA family protein
MRWVLGLDLRPRSAGALRFAGWLASAAPGESFVAVHVLEEELLRTALRTRHLDEVVAAAGQAAREALEGEPSVAAAARLEVTRGVVAAETLDEARLAHAADGIVVGRAAGSTEWRLVRLGRTARRLVRALRAPVVVVPPDLAPEQVGAGPVVALASLREDSAEACRFAAAFAARTGRPLVVLHVCPALASSALPYLPAEPMERAARELVLDAERDLAAFLASTGVAPQRAVVRPGDVVEEALALVGAQRAALLVVGAHRRGGLERWVAPSTGRDLAASAPVPVAIVPPA